MKKKRKGNVKKERAIYRKKSNIKKNNGQYEKKKG